MKILFLHLSDLHIKSIEAKSNNHIEKLLDTLREYGSFDEMVLFLSGDIAFSGSKEEYSVANKTLNKIFTDIKRKNIFKKYINIFCVPGI